MLALEDDFLALCIHGTKHTWEALKWSYDIACLLQHNAIDWETVVRRSRAARCSRPLALAVRLASTLFKVGLPREFSPLMAPSAPIQKLEVMITNALYSGRTFTRKELFSLQIRSHERLWDRIFVAVSSPALDLPRILPVAARPISGGPLRFVLKPVRLVHHYGFRWLYNALAA
jgi:hypothetical protein